MKAISSPLLETSIEGAMGVLINFCAENMNMQEIETASNLIYNSVDVDAEIIIGAISSESDMSDDMMVTIIATGFESSDLPKDNIIISANKNKPVSNSVNPSSPVVAPPPIKKVQDDDMDIPAFLRRNRKTNM
jgi:cell division protein FtsZ